jgi:hypothetical protein
MKIAHLEKKDRKGLKVGMAKRVFWKLYLSKAAVVAFLFRRYFFF